MNSETWKAIKGAAAAYAIGLLVGLIVVLF